MWKRRAQCEYLEKDNLVAYGEYGASKDICVLGQQSVGWAVDTWYQVPRHVVPGLVVLWIGLDYCVCQLFRVARVVRAPGESRDADTRFAGLNGRAGTKGESY